MLMSKANVIQTWILNFWALVLVEFKANLHYFVKNFHFIENGK